jgi:acetyl esterase/lipase
MGTLRQRNVMCAAVAFVATCLPCRGDDPRAPADAPFEASSQPQPRMSRRAQRRANRRKTTPADLPPAPATKIDVTATLGSPFEAMGAEALQPFIAHRNQPYAEACRERQHFDLYLPKGCGGSLPLVVWIQGDTWQSAPESGCPVIWLVESGYAVACVDFRPSDIAPFPAQLDDCLAAIGTLERDAEIWGIDRDRICVAGSAAGGHLAALAGLWDETTPDRPPPHVAAVCAINAPTHLTTLGPDHDRATSAASRLVGGPLPEFREAAQRASPLTHVSADDPPVLLVHARGHAAVPFEQSEQFASALQSAGVRGRLVTVEGSAAAARPDRDSPAGIALLEFLDASLGPGPRPDAGFVIP